MLKSVLDNDWLCLGGKLTIHAALVIGCKVEAYTSFVVSEGEYAELSIPRGNLALKLVTRVPVLV